LTSPEDRARDAAQGLAFLAAMFCAQAETWPVFAAWAAQLTAPEPWQLDHAGAVGLVDVLCSRLLARGALDDREQFHP